MREHTCTFIGHRECFGLKAEQVRTALESLISQGVTEFLCGGMGEFDWLCARQVYLLKKEYPCQRKKALPSGRAFLYFIGFLFGSAGEVSVFLHGHIRGTDDLASADQFFHAMSAPTGDTGNGENGSVKFHGQVQHTVDEAAVKVHVGRNALVDFPLFGDELGGQTFHIAVKLKFVGAALLF